MLPRHLFAITTIAAALAHAAPVRLVHSGRLLDDADRPVTAAVTLTVALHTSAGLDPTVPDAVRWTGTYEGVPVANGIYGLELGREGGPTLEASVFDGADLWLGVGVNGGTELKPRLRIGTVPQAAMALTAATAAHAADADRLGGQLPEEFAAATHTHAAAEIAGLAEALAAAEVSWETLADRPATFPPSAHTHDASALTSGQIDNERLHLGAGGGIDADLLDGRHADAFADVEHTHVAEEITDFGAKAIGALANASIPGGLALAGGLRLGQAATCDAAAAGTLRFDPTKAVAARVVELCDGEKWKAVGTLVDRAPDAFTFDAATANPDTTVTTAAVTLGGFEVILTASCEGCTIDKNGSGTFTSSVIVLPGDRIRLRAQSGSTNGSRQYAVTVGETSATWTLTTTVPQYTLLGSAGRPGYWNSTPREECVAAGYSGTTHVSTSSTVVNDQATASNRGGTCRNHTIDERASGMEFWGYHYCGSPSWAGFYCWKAN